MSRENFSVFLSLLQWVYLRTQDEETLELIRQLFNRVHALTLE